MQKLMGAMSLSGQSHGEWCHKEEVVISSIYWKYSPKSKKAAVIAKQILEEKVSEAFNGVDVEISFTRRDKLGRPGNSMEIAEIHFKNFELNPVASEAPIVAHNEFTA